MKKTEVHTCRWKRYMGAVPFIMLTFVELSAQSAPMGPTEAMRDRLPIYEILPTSPQAEITAPYDEDLTSLFTPIDISHKLYPSRVISLKIKPSYSLMEVNRLSSPNKLNMRIPANSGGNISLLSKGKCALSLTSSRNNYHSTGFANSVTVEQAWTITDKITLSGGVYASDNLFHRNRFKDFGVSGRVQVKVAERITLSGYGSYSLYNSVSGQRSVPPMMFPGNYYGGSVQIKITDKFGLECGVQRGFSMFTRQWETSYYVLPVLY